MQSDLRAPARASPFGDYRVAGWRIRQLDGFARRALSALAEAGAAETRLSDVRDGGRPAVFDASYSRTRSTAPALRSATGHDSWRNGHYLGPRRCRFPHRRTPQPTARANPRPPQCPVWTNARRRPTLVGKWRQWFRVRARLEKGDRNEDDSLLRLQGLSGNGGVPGNFFARRKTSYGSSSNSMPRSLTTKTRPRGLSNGFQY